MMSRIGVALMAACLALYVAAVAWGAVIFVSSGTAVGIGMGIATVIIAGLGGWALIREIMFGVASDRLGRTLDAEGGMPTSDVERRPSGRLPDEEAHRLIQQYSTQAEESADDWRAHYRLGVVFDASGQRKNARASIRRAIETDRQQRR